MSVNNNIFYNWLNYRFEDGTEITVSDMELQEKLHNSPLMLDVLAAAVCGWPREFTRGEHTWSVDLKGTVYELSVKVADIKAYSQKKSSCYDIQDVQIKENCEIPKDLMIRNQFKIHVSEEVRTRLLQKDKANHLVPVELMQKCLQKKEGDLKKMQKNADLSRDKIRKTYYITIRYMSSSEDKRAIVDERILLLVMDFYPSTSNANRHSKVLTTAYFPEKSYVISENQLSSEADYERFLAERATVEWVVFR